MKNTGGKAFSDSINASPAFRIVKQIKNARKAARRRRAVDGNSQFAPAALAADINSYKGQIASSDDIERFRQSRDDWKPLFSRFFSLKISAEGQGFQLTFLAFGAILLLMTETTDAAVADSFNEICKILSECSDENEAKDFLACLCTPAERADFSKRWLSVKELYKGTPQREIAKKFNMSLCKITRGSRELRKENSAFRKILEKEKKL